MSPETLGINMQMALRSIRRATSTQCFNAIVAVRVDVDHGHTDFLAERTGLQPLAMCASISAMSQRRSEPSFTPYGISPASAQRKIERSSAEYFAATTCTSPSLRPGGTGGAFVELLCSTSAFLGSVMVTDSTKGVICWRAQSLPDLWSLTGEQKLSFGCVSEPCPKFVRLSASRCPLVAVVSKSSIGARLRHTRVSCYVFLHNFLHRQRFATSSVLLELLDARLCVSVQ
jgi:hypothetical protein